MRILMTGATGLIGSALVAALRADGHDVVRIVRSEPAAGSGDIQFDPKSHVVNTDPFEGADAVVHLAGENVAQHWTPEARKRIRSSRIGLTEVLTETVAQLDKRPRVFASASATGYYGDRGDEVLTEDSPPGAGFLAEVCQEWEAATQPAAEAGIRVANLRFAPVLTPQGGVLAKILTPFRMGMGGKLGSGDQYMSWIALDDALAAIRYVLETDGLEGPFNVTSPNPVTNRDFTQTLGKVLGRPTFFTVPAAAARAAMGEMADETMLASARVVPARLQAAGFTFLFPDLEPALRHLLES